jgi:uncharacterized membrane protein YhaH (DUF805 family)
MQWYSMVWKKYADFSGRARRTEYWMFSLFNVIAIFVLAAIGGAGLAIASNDPTEGMLFFIPLLIYTLASIIPSLAVTTRRLLAQFPHLLPAPIPHRRQAPFPCSRRLLAHMPRPRNLQ